MVLAQWDGFSGFGWAHSSINSQLPVSKWLCFWGLTGSAKVPGLIRLCICCHPAGHPGVVVIVAQYGARRMNRNVQDLFSPRLRSGIRSLLPYYSSKKVTGQPRFKGKGTESTSQWEKLESTGRGGGTMSHRRKEVGE